MANGGKKTVKILVRLAAAGLAVLVIGFIAFSIYGASRMGKAKKQVGAFCSQDSVGMAVADLEKKADRMELAVDTVSGDDRRTGIMRVWDGFMLARWICDIRYEDGKVKSKQLRSID